ncbi:MAG TPA: hypothetical protein VEC56_11470 [Candidatus Krumholzibacteria bacterium]|nr:hypothetical protein [Candidatus Krumholzibacteria bacterium]
MKKLTAILALVGVFGVGALVGLRATTAQAGPCYYRCICSVAYKCCTTETGTTCKAVPNAPINCPQVAC